MCDICSFSCSGKTEKEEHVKTSHEYDQYEKLSGRDKFEVQELICEQLCVGCENWHRCWSNESDLEYKGINLKGVTGVYDMKKTNVSL